MFIPLSIGFPYLYADIEYTQSISEGDIEAQGSVSNPSDPQWRESLSHIITSGDGYYWQGSDASGDCYLQFDLRSKKEVNCFRLFFYETNLRRYQFRIYYNVTTNNPNGVYYPARSRDWSNKMNGDALISYYLDSTIEARYFRIYFYGNDGNDINSHYVRMDEVRIWYIGYRMVTPNASCEWHTGNYYTILYTQFPDSGDPRDYPKRIELYKNNTKVCNIDNDVINSGQKGWTVGSDTDTSTTADTNLYSGSDYTVRVVDLRGYGTLISDRFRIVGGLTPGPTSAPANTPTPGPTPERNIYMKSPRQGDEWMQCKSYPIEWTSVNMHGNVSISVHTKYRTEGFPMWIAGSITNIGYFLWKVPYEFETTSGYYFCVTSDNYSDIRGKSSYFSIIEAPTVSNPELGDVNCDGNVDIVDSLLVAQYFIGIECCLYFEEYADVNLDGLIDIVDSLLIAQYYINEIPSLPPPPELTNITMDIELPESISWGGINHWIPNPHFSQEFTLKIKSKTNLL